MMDKRRYVLIRPYVQKETRRWKLETIILDWETLQFEARKTRCMELCLLWNGEKCIIASRFNDVCAYFISSCRTVLE